MNFRSNEPQVQWDFLGQVNFILKLTEIEGDKETNYQRDSKLTDVGGQFDVPKVICLFVTRISRLIYKLLPIFHPNTPLFRPLPISSLLPPYTHKHKGIKIYTQTHKHKWGAILQNSTKSMMGSNPPRVHSTKFVLVVAHHLFFAFFTVTLTYRIKKNVLFCLDFLNFCF